MTIRFLRLIVVLMLGPGFLAAAGYLYVDTTQFIAAASKATGTVIDLEQRSKKGGKTYAPVVEFVTKSGESRTFSSRVSNDPPAFAQGETVEVLYIEANDFDARINTFWQLWERCIIFGSIGTFTCLIVTGVFLYRWLKKRTTEHLISSGRRIDADIVKIAINERRASKNGRPYQIFAQWQDPATSKIHEFISENIWFNPEEYVNRKTLAVYVDTNNFSKYYVDISFLPKLEE